MWHACANFFQHLSCCVECVSLNPHNITQSTMKNDPQLNDLQRTKLQPNRSVLLWACGLAFFMFGLTSAMIGPSLVDLATALGTTVVAMGLFRSARQIGQLIGFITFGKSADQMNLRSLALWGGCTMSMGLLCTPFFNYHVALIAVVLWGVGHSIYNLAPNIIIGREFQAQSSSTMTMLHGVYGLGAICGPFLVEILRPFPIQNLYFICAFMTLMAALLYWFGTRACLANSPPSITHAEQHAIKFNPRILAPYIMGVLLFSGANFTASDWLHYYTETIIGKSSITASIVTSSFWLAMTMGRFLMGWAVARSDEKRIIRFAALHAVIGAGMLCGSSFSIVFIVLGVILLGLGLAPVYPILMASAANRFAENRGQITGILAASSAIGAIVLPVLQGWLSSTHQQGLVVVLIAALLMARALWSIPLQSKQLS